MVTHVALLDVLRMDSNHPQSLAEWQKAVQVGQKKASQAKKPP